MASPWHRIAAYGDAIEGLKGAVSAHLSALRFQGYGSDEEVVARSNVEDALDVLADAEDAL